MTPANGRQPSVENVLTLGRALRQALADSIQPDDLVDRGFPKVSSALPRGTLTDDRWFTALHLPAFHEEVRRTSAAASDVMDAQAGVILQAWTYCAELLKDPHTPALPPVVVPIRPGSRTRVGFFTFATDRDAFVAELLGATVPLHPRHSPRAPLPEMDLDGDAEDVRDAMGFGAEAAELYGLSRPSALRSVAVLRGVLSRAATGDETRVALLDWLLAMPETLASSPLGRVLLPVARGASRWRHPNVQFELVATHDLGGMTRHVGTALWTNSVEMRQHRAQMAAHLRYQFDCRVAPWKRWTDARARRELILLHFRRGWPAAEIPAHTVREVAESLRRGYAHAYEAEPASRTLTRLYGYSSKVLATR